MTSSTPPQESLQRILGELRAEGYSSLATLVEQFSKLTWPRDARIEATDGTLRIAMPKLGHLVFIAEAANGTTYSVADHNRDVDVDVDVSFALRVTRRFLAPAIEPEEDFTPVRRLLSEFDDGQRTVRVASKGGDI